jgi:hypothetical protein
MRARVVVVRTLTVVGAWLPFFLFWVLFFLSYAGQKIELALWSGAIAIGSAAILGIAVWRFCASQPWPLREYGRSEPDPSGPRRRDRAQDFR